MGGGGARNDNAQRYRKGPPLSRACPSDGPFHCKTFVLPEVGSPAQGEERARQSHMGRGPRVPSATESHCIRMPLVRADRPNPPALFKNQPQRPIFQLSNVSKNDIHIGEKQWLLGQAGVLSPGRPFCPLLWPSARALPLCGGPSCLDRPFLSPKAQKSPLMFSLAFHPTPGSSAVTAPRHRSLASMVMELFTSVAHIPMPLCVCVCMCSVCVCARVCVCVHVL